MCRWRPRGCLDLISEDDPLYAGRPGYCGPARSQLRVTELRLPTGHWRPHGHSRHWILPSTWRAVPQSYGGHRSGGNQQVGRPLKRRICADAGDSWEMLRQRQDSPRRKTRLLASALPGLEARYPVVQDEHRAPGRVSIFHLTEVISEAVSQPTRSFPGVPGAASRSFCWPTVESGRRVFHTAGLGAMGFGIPASIGVCLAGGASHDLRGWRRRFPAQHSGTGHGRARSFRSSSSC